VTVLCVLASVTAWAGPTAEPRLEAPPRPPERAARVALPPPVGPVAPAIEHDPVDAVMFTAWSESVAASYLEIAAALAARNVVARVCTRDDEREQSSRDDLELAGLSEAVEWVDCELNSLWVRDYGPIYGADGLGHTLWGDAVYAAARPLDDAFPAVAARWDGGTPYRIPLAIDGGNLMMLDDGRCATTTQTTERTGLTAGELADALWVYAGCDGLLVVEPLPGESTGHIDVFAVHGPGGVGVGSYEPSREPAAAAVLDGVADQFAAAGYPVVRVPMPRRDDSNADGYDEWRTHTNLLPVNAADAPFALVPVYEDDREAESAAWAALGEVFPGWELVPIEALPLVQLGGAVHCVTKSIPASSPPIMPQEPAAACGCRGGPAGPVGGAWMWGIALLNCSRRRRQRDHGFAAHRAHR
jgi:agmatine deiminase